MSNFPKEQGLYSQKFEHDSCGIGFVANIKGQKSHEIVLRGLEILERMAHRGAEGADNKTGDGAGVSVQIPDKFYRDLIVNLPLEGEYGTGLVFLPTKKKDLDFCLKITKEIVEKEEQQIIAWRDVPVKSKEIGEIAKKTEPKIKQIFIKSRKKISQTDLERKLYIIRKQIENKIRTSSLPQKDFFYLVSLSTKTIVYKGMLAPDQVSKFYPDLKDKRFSSAIAMVHSRFSTNTFPAWSLAQPFRILSHNGEINTVKGNRFWMQAREADFFSENFGKNLNKILPVIEPGKSDSASFDNALEMLVATGRSLPHSLMMLIPESWNEKNPLPESLKFFYEYHANFMEPWDGPASMVFCDGRYVGGTLDRNGLRPSRYVVTKDDLIVMGSEVGVQEFPAHKVKEKGRLKPGKILLVDTKQGRIIPDEEIKKKIYSQNPYRSWVEKNRIKLADLPNPKTKNLMFSEKKLKKEQAVFGYNREDVENLITPMVKDGQEPTGAMGTDTPLAILSSKPQRLFNYFKQIFAQVTNPAIDPIREELVMSLTSFLGAKKNLLTETEDHCRLLKIKNPILTATDLVKIESLNENYFKSSKVSMAFDIKDGEQALKKGLDRLCLKVEKQIDSGSNLIILSDRQFSKNIVPIPSLLACSTVHHYLLRKKKRMKADLIIESGEPREVMHFALLFGYGAGAIYPYTAFETIKNLIQNKELNLSYYQAEKNYIKAINKGLLKIFSKMGTSTLRSYRGSQVFEAIGLSRDLIKQFFPGTESRLGGISLKEIQQETLNQHQSAFQENSGFLKEGGIYRYRKQGEKHAWNPETISLLQRAVRENSYKIYQDFAHLVNKENQEPRFLRGFFKFKKGKKISLSQVEPKEEIFKRFCTGAMSFGSLSKEVHEAMAMAMNKIGGKSNSGEGGENTKRFKPEKDGSWKRSAIKQVASGRFGVTSNYLANADEIQIKIAQGAKPGEGGQLPGHKVDSIIAKTRFSTPGVTLISPPPHHDIYSIEDLAQLIFDLKNANPQARISVKLVSETGVGTVAAGVAKAYADNILISGYDGGTGASPQSSIKHAGLPWELGLAETHQTLVLNNLRGRVRLQTDGQLKTGLDVVLAAILGAEEFGFGTAALITLGCVMMRKCHLNTCPVGVATQDPELRKKFKGDPEHLINYFYFMAQEVREIMAELGVKKFNDLVGQTQYLKVTKVDHWKAKKLDPSPLLYSPQANQAKRPNFLYCQEKQRHKIDNILDRALIKNCQKALQQKKRVSFSTKIKNTDRTVGAMLSNQVSIRYGEKGLPEDTIQITFEGSAGQSFGAFLTKGTTFRLEGDANDYFGKGLSGGKLIALPPAGSTFEPEKNIIIGNTVLYGATGGEVFIKGVAGERFGVRNSGAIAVIEGTGDHCAEYMTGGKLLVLGKVGRNFAAGMSGGIAYVLNEDGKFQYFCNSGMVELSSVLEEEDQAFIKKYLKKHFKYTNSKKANLILKNWHSYLPKFVKIIPFEYQRVLKELELKKIEAKIKIIKKNEQLGEESDG